MSEKATMEFEVDQETGGIRVKIEIHSESCLNRDATFTLESQVRVKYSRAKHSSRISFQHNFRTNRSRIEFAIPKTSFSGYWYDGSKIAIECHGTLRIDDGLVADTTLQEKLVCTQIQRPKVRTNAKELMDPDDSFDFSTNLEQLSPIGRFGTAGLILFSIVAMCMVFVFFNSGGDVESSRRSADDSGPLGALLGSLFLCFLIGAGAWYLIKGMLRQYMTFTFNQLPNRIDRSTAIPVKKLVSGISRCDLHNVVLRVVACNVEKGKYVRGRGSSREVIKFKNPVRCVLLHEQPVDMIPKNVPVENYFEGIVDFGAMFDVLYPPYMIGSVHGIDVHWEVQLLHDELVDQELTGPCTGLHYQDFFTDGT